MFVPAPIDKNFVPYGNRRVLRGNAGLIIDSGGGKGGGSVGAAPRVVPQSCIPGTPCGPRCPNNPGRHQFMCSQSGHCTEFVGC
jgi:hypothetical protein